ncbi:MAG: lipopolysaccharide biosynthesis protein [Bacteroidia bacterium]|jgi:hypothetical protein|nr:lipopolysaccharide biosynthesis protein [Bacteroidia bacterium]
MDKPNEITIKEIVLSFITWKNYLLTKWKQVILTAVTFGLIGLTYAFMQNKLYQAELTFALDEKGSAASSYASIASQFGIDIGKGDGGVFVGDNIMELFKSRLIIEKTLLSKQNHPSDTDLILNYYIKTFEFDKGWEDKEQLKDLKFTSTQPRHTFSRIQDSILGLVSSSIKKNNLLVEKYDKRLNIISVKVKSFNERFSKMFCEKLAENVHAFYIESKTKKIRRSVDLLQNRVDSVHQALIGEMYGLAVNQDQNINPSRMQGKVGLNQKQINIQMLTSMYVELTKNLEISRLTLMKEEPLIQVIERPIAPLPYTKPSKLISLIIGGFLGGLLSVAYFVIKKILRNSVQ